MNTLAGTIAIIAIVLFLDCQILLTFPKIFYSLLRDHLHDLSAASTAFYLTSIMILIFNFVAIAIYRLIMYARLPL